MAQTIPSAASTVTKALVRSGDLLGLRRAEVASLLNLNSESLDQLVRGEVALTEGTTQWQRALMLIDVCRLLSGLVGEDGRHIQLWMCRFNDGLLAAPKSLIFRPNGIAQLVEYLRQHSEGAFA